MHDACFGQGYVQAEDRLGQLEYDRRRAARPVGRGRRRRRRRLRRVRAPLRARRRGSPRVRRARRRRRVGVLDAFADGVNAWLALGTTAAAGPRAGRRASPSRGGRGTAARCSSSATSCSRTGRRSCGAAGSRRCSGPRPSARIESSDTRGAPADRPAWRALPRVAPARSSACSTTVLAAMAAAAAIAEVAAGSNAGRCTGRAPRRACRCSPATRTASSRRRACTRRATSRATSSTRSGCRSSACPASRTSATTDRVAWCVTNAQADYQDLYVERFAPGDPSRASSRAAGATSTYRREVIEVRGADPVELDCFETHHGPVVFGDPATGVAIAMASTAIAEPSTGLAVLAPMLRARTVDELDDVMREWVDPVNNFVSADVDGQIAYRTVGRIPVRSAANAWGPVPGWTGGHDWTGDRAVRRAPAARRPRRRRDRHREPAHRRPRLPALPRPRLLACPTAPGVSPNASSRCAPRRSTTWPRSTATGARSAPTCGWSGSTRPRARRRARARRAGRAAHMGSRDGRRLGRRGGLRRRPRRHVQARRPHTAPRGAPRALPGRAGGDLPAARAAAVGRAAGPARGRRPAAAPPRARRGRTCSPPRSPTVSRSCAPRSATTPRRGGGARCTARRPTHPLSGAHPEWGGRLDPPAVEMGGEWDTVFSDRASGGLRLTASRARRSLATCSTSRTGTGAAGSCRPACPATPTRPHFADQRLRWAAGELDPDALHPRRDRGARQLDDAARPRLTAGLTAASEEVAAPAEEVDAPSRSGIGARATRSAYARLAPGNAVSLQYGSSGVSAQCVT